MTVIGHGRKYNGLICIAFQEYSQLSEDHQVMVSRNEWRFYQQCESVSQEVLHTFYKSIVEFSLRKRRIQSAKGDKMSTDAKICKMACNIDERDCTVDFSKISYSSERIARTIIWGSAHVRWNNLSGPGSDKMQSTNFWSLIRPSIIFSVPQCFTAYRSLVSNRFRDRAFLGKICAYAHTKYPTYLHT